jgi:hypothetical protein
VAFRVAPISTELVGLGELDLVRFGLLVGWLDHSDNPEVVVFTHLFSCGRQSHAKLMSEHGSFTLI